MVLENSSTVMTYVSIFTVTIKNNFDCTWLLAIKTFYYSPLSLFYEPSEVKRNTPRIYINLCFCSLPLKHFELYNGMKYDAPYLYLHSEIFFFIFKYLIVIISVRFVFQSLLLNFWRWHPDCWRFCNISFS